MVSNGFSCFASCDASELPGTLPVRPSRKLPDGGGRKLDGGLWKDRLGLVLRFRLLETLRARLFTLPAMSCGGVMVGTEFAEGARAGV